MLSVLLNKSASRDNSCFLVSVIVFSWWVTCVENCSNRVILFSNFAKQLLYWQTHPRNATFPYFFFVSLGNLRQISLISFQFCNDVFSSLHFWWQNILFAARIQSFCLHSRLQTPILFDWIFVQPFRVFQIPSQLLQLRLVILKLNSPKTQTVQIILRNKSAKLALRTREQVLPPWRGHFLSAWTQH